MLSQGKLLDVSVFLSLSACGFHAHSSQI